MVSILKRLVPACTWNLKEAARPARVFFRTFPEFMELFHEIKPMTNFDIIELCKILKIKNFKGVYMRNELNGKEAARPALASPVGPAWSLILNLDDSNGNGTHWTCLFVKGK